jgi:hypothetical protein
MKNRDKYLINFYVQKTCDRNINQIKFAYEKGCIDLFCFYL